MKLLRKTLGLTQSAFAEKLGTVHQIIYLYEKPSYKINERYIKLICLTFSVNEEWFREGKGEMFDVPPNDLSDTDKKIMSVYVKIPPEKREILNQAIMIIAEQFNAGDGKENAETEDLNIADK